MDRFTRRSEYPVGRKFSSRKPLGGDKGETSVSKVSAMSVSKSHFNLPPNFEEDDEYVVLTDREKKMYRQLHREVHRLEKRVHFLEKEVEFLSPKVKTQEKLIRELSLQNSLLIQSFNSSPIKPSKDLDDDDQRQVQNKHLVDLKLNASEIMLEKNPQIIQVNSQRVSTPHEEKAALKRESDFEKAQPDKPLPKKTQRPLLTNIPDETTENRDISYQPKKDPSATHAVRGSRSSLHKPRMRSPAIDGGETRFEVKRKPEPKRFVSSQERRKKKFSDFLRSPDAFKKRKYGNYGNPVPERKPHRGEKYGRKEKVDMIDLKLDLEKLSSKEDIGYSRYAEMFYYNPLEDLKSLNRSLERSFDRLKNLDFST